MRHNIIPLQKYEKWLSAVGKKNWEFFGVRFQTANLANNGRSARKVDRFLRSGIINC